MRGFASRQSLSALDISRMYLPSFFSAQRAKNAKNKSLCATVPQSHIMPALRQRLLLDLAAFAQFGQFEGTGRDVPDLTSALSALQINSETNIPGALLPIPLPKFF
jgi:hypothetical protein